MTALTYDRHPAGECGDLGKALSLLIQWGKEAHAEKATADDPRADVAPPEPARGMSTDILPEPAP